MNITFLDAAGVVQFVRDDYESGNWRQQEYTVNMTFPFDKDKIIERGMRLSFPNPANGVYQFFEIRNVQNIEPDAYQQIIAEHIAVSELSDEHIDSVEISEKTALEALTTALDGTLWEPGNSSVNGTENADFSRGSVWQTISIIQSNWNCHIVPRVEINDDGSISGRYLDIVPAEGTFRGLRLSIYRNMSDSTVTYDDTECLTALYGYGGAVDVPQGGGQQDKTEELTFKDVVWTATAEHPAKPSGQLYLEDPAKTALYGRDGRARYGYYQNSDIKDAEILLAKTWEALKATSQPKISITGTVADLKRLGFPDVSPELWDKVIVDVIDTGETFVKQIIQNDVDLCDPTATVPTIGDYIPNIIYINRETNERASGRGGGGSRGQTNIQHEDGEFFSEFRKTTDMVGMVVGTYNGGYKIDAGRIALAINEDGSNAYIEANHVIVNGETILTTALEEIRSEVWAADSSAHSAIIQTASEIRSEVVASESDIYSTISQTASEIRSEVASTDSGLRSTILQTASGIMIQVGKKARVFHQFTDPVLTEDVSEGDFWVMDSGIRTYGQAEDDTWNALSAYTWGDFFGAIIYVRDENDNWAKVGGDQLSEISNGKIEVTDEFIRAWKESGVDFAGISIEQDRILSRVASVEQGLTSVIEQTASMIRTAVFTANSEMYSEILQTQSMIHSTVVNAESNIYSEIYQTASVIQLNVNKKSSVYFQMTDPTQDSPPATPNLNDVWIKSNKLNTYGQAGLKTWAELGAYTWMDYYGSQMYAWDGQQWQPISDEQKSNYNYTLLEQTETALTSVKGDLSGAYSLIRQTKSEIQSVISDRVNGLQSSITQTASQIRLEVTDKVNSLSSSITQTAGQIRSEVNAANSQIYSAITQTASQIRLEVTNKTSSLQSLITQEANRISLVVQGTGSNAAIKAAQIVAAINNGGSSILISANHITMDGTVKLSDALSVQGIGVLLKKTLFCQGNLALTGTYQIGFEDENVWLSGSTLASTIKSASVSGNTLTLTNYAGSTVNFSKATNLSPSWNGSVLSIKAQQTNGGTTTDVATNTVGLGGSSYGTHTIDLAMTQNGTPTIVSGSDVLMPVKIVQKQGGGATTDRANTNLQYSLASLLTTGSYNTAGTKTPGSGYIGFSSVTFTIPNASGFTRNATSYNTSGSNQVGSISKSGLTANSYMYWTVGGKKFHIVVNA